MIIFKTPCDAERAALAGCAAQQAIQACRDGFGSPDALLHGLQEAARSDGQSIGSTPAIRQYLRALQKHIEQS